jgi:hypothetical protein
MVCASLRADHGLARLAKRFIRSRKLALSHRRGMCEADSVQLTPPPQPAESARPAPGRRVRALRGFRLLAAAAVLVPLLAVLGAGAFSWREVMRETESRLARTLDMLHQHALRAFTTQEAILVAVQHSIDGMGWEELHASAPLHRLLAGLAAAGAPLVGSIRISGPDQQVAIASDHFPAEPETLPAPDVMAAIGAGAPGTVLGAPEPAGGGSGAGARPIFAVARARPVPEGAPPGSAGAIISSFSPQAFSDFYQAVRETGGDSVALVREDGAVLVRVPPAPSPERREALAEWLRGAPEDTDRSFGFRLESSPVDGGERLFAASSMGWMRRRSGRSGPIACCRRWRGRWWRRGCCSA